MCEGQLKFKCNDIIEIYLISSISKLMFWFQNNFEKGYHKKKCPVHFWVREFDTLFADPIECAFNIFSMFFLNHIFQIYLYHVPLSLVCFNCNRNALFVFIKFLNLNLKSSSNWNQSAFSTSFLNWQIQI